MRAATRPILEFDLRIDVPIAYQIVVEITKNLQSGAGHENHVQTNPILGTLDPGQCRVNSST